MKALWIDALSEYSESSQMAGYRSGLVYFVRLPFGMSELRCTSVVPFKKPGGAGLQANILGSPTCLLNKAAVSQNTEH